MILSPPPRVQGWSAFNARSAEAEGGVKVSRQILSTKARSQLILQHRTMRDWCNGLFRDRSPPYRTDFQGVEKVKEV
jgi:hypothetical protein